MKLTLEEVQLMIDDSIPSLPPTAMKIMRLVNDIHCSPSALGKVIKLDPVLAARVLKVVNSTYFSLPEKIISVEHAVILLGVNTVKNIALSTAILSQMKKTSNVYAFDVWRYWKHSLAVAATAKLIATKRNVARDATEEFFMAGLLHKLGLLVENHLFIEEMRRIVTKATMYGLIPAEESELDGLNHCMIGEILAKTWNLGENLSYVMRNYYAPPLEVKYSELVLTVHLSSVFCRKQEICLDFDGGPEEVKSFVFEKLNFEMSVLDEITEALEAEIEKATVFLQQ